MAQALRAVYEHGRLRLLDPVDLAEGQQIVLVILSDRERVQNALGNLVVRYEDEPESDIDEVALLADIDREMQGKPPISDAIIEERQEGP